jgi:hypothetical protein
MNLQSATDRTERSRIERGIRKNDLSLSKIREDRRRLVVGLAELKSLSRLLASRLQADLSRSGIQIQANRREIRSRNRSARYRSV